jgi:hypothetical protein
MNAHARVFFRVSISGFNSRGDCREFSSHGNECKTAARHPAPRGNFHPGISQAVKIENGSDRAGLCFWRALFERRLLWRGEKAHRGAAAGCLEPSFAILDETDSGLDIDAIRIVSEGVNALKGPKMGVMVITHYQRILNYLKPDFVHVMFDGRIVESGGEELALQLEEHGYDWVREKYDQKTAA